MTALLVPVRPRALRATRVGRRRAGDAACPGSASDPAIWRRDYWATIQPPMPASPAPPSRAERSGSPGVRSCARNADGGRGFHGIVSGEVDIVGDRVVERGISGVLR